MQGASECGFPPRRFDSLIRKLLDSPAFYFFLAGVLLVAALLSQFERVGADAPGGRVEDLRGLAARQDLNVVFILIDTLNNPLISGAESVLINIALVSLPVEEGNELLRQVIDEVKQRQNGPTRQPARLLIWGSIIDNTALFEMIESLGASVVIDDTSMGSRAYMTPVEITEDPLDGLAYHYLVDLRSPRTFRETVLNEAKRKDYITDLENRFSHLREYAGEWHINGVLLQALRYCDTHGYEVPGLRHYLDSIGLPSIYLEHDYTETALAQLRTRVQAFLEIIG